MNNQDKVELVKRGVRFAMFPAIGYIFVNASPPSSPYQSNLEKALVMFGRVAIVSLVAEVTAKHVEHRIDQAIEWYDVATSKDD